MKRILSLSCFFFLSFVLVGCAFTVHKTSLNYTYKGDVPLENTKYSKSAIIGDFTDQRGTSTPNTIIHLRNGHGVQTSGGYEAEKPISVIVKEAITSGLNQVGLMNNNNNYFLSGSIEKFYIDSKADQAFTRKYKGVLSVKIQLTDVKTKKIIFRDTFTGEKFASIDSSSEEDIVKDTFKTS